MRFKRRVRTPSDCKMHRHHRHNVRRRREMHLLVRGVEAGMRTTGWRLLHMPQKQSNHYEHSHCHTGVALAYLSFIDTPDVVSSVRFWWLLYGKCILCSPSRLAWNILRPFGNGAVGWSPICGAIPPEVFLYTLPVLMRCDYINYVGIAASNSQLCSVSTSLCVVPGFKIRSVRLRSWCLACIFQSLGPKMGGWTWLESNSLF